MEGSYNIYFVHLPSSIKLGYDSYSEFVAIAQTAAEARTLHPSSSVPLQWGEKRKEWVSYNELPLLIVEKIGTAAKKYYQTQVICANFHAG